MSKKNIDIEIADAILESPIGIEIGGQHFYFYPATLGKNLMSNNLLMKAGFSFEKFAENPIVEAMRISKKDIDAVMKVIAINLLRTKDEVTNKATVDRFAAKLKAMMSKTEVSTMLITIITRDNNSLTSFIKGTDILRDREDMKKINAVKNSKGTFLFGRRTMYGQIIDTVCNRYGWTLDYVLWGISYINIQMLIADMEVSVFLSDNEMKRVHISNDRDTLNGDDPSMKEKIMEMFNE